MFRYFLSAYLCVFCLLYDPVPLAAQSPAGWSTGEKTASDMAFSAPSPRGGLATDGRLDRSTGVRMAKIYHALGDPRSQVRAAGLALAGVGTVGAGGAGAVSGQIGPAVAAGSVARWAASPGARAAAAAMRGSFGKIGVIGALLAGAYQLLKPPTPVDRLPAAQTICPVGTLRVGAQGNPPIRNNHCTHGSSVYPCHPSASQPDNFTTNSYFINPGLTSSRSVSPPWSYPLWRPPYKFLDTPGALLGPGYGRCAKTVSATWSTVMSLVAYHGRSNFHNNSSYVASICGGQRYNSPGSYSVSLGGVTPGITAVENTTFSDSNESVTVTVDTAYLDYSVTYPSTSGDKCSDKTLDFVDKLASYRPIGSSVTDWNQSYTPMTDQEIWDALRPEDLLPLLRADFECWVSGDCPSSFDWPNFFDCRTDAGVKRACTPGDFRDVPFTGITGGLGLDADGNRCNPFAQEGQVGYSATCQLDVMETPTTGIDQTLRDGPPLEMFKEFDFDDTGYDKGNFRFGLPTAASCPSFPRVVIRIPSIGGVGGGSINFDMPTSQICSFIAALGKVLSVISMWLAVFIVIKNV